MEFAPLSKHNEKTGFYKDLVRIALPIALQNLVISSVNMLDTVMVGQLGTKEIAAVGLGNQIWFLLILFLFGLGTGSGVFIAQYWGKKDIDGIRKTTGVSLAVGLSVSLVWCAAAFGVPRFLMGLYSEDAEVVALAADYLRWVSPSYPFAAASFVFSLSLRGVEKVRLPLAATIVSLAINAALNYIFIFGAFWFPAMGVRGAAFATVVSRVIEAVIIFKFAYSRALPPAGTIRELTHWDGVFISRFLYIALPVIINEVFWSLGITCYNVIFARVGTDAFAAYNVTITISQLMMVFFMGSANAGSVMIGKRIGAGDKTAAFAWAHRFALLSPAAGLCFGLVLLPLSAIVPLMFNLGSAPLRETQRMLYVLAAVFPFKVFNLHVLLGVFRAGGDTRFGAFFDLFGVWVVGVPLAAFGAFVLRVDPWMVFALLCLDEAGKFGLGLWRLASKKWLNEVIA